MYIIYALEDQRYTGVQTIRYIGLTEDVYSRFAQHLQCTENNIDKNEWITNLKNANVMLIMRTIEVVETLEEARKREQHWIHYYLALNAHLLNVDIARSFSLEILSILCY